MKCLCKLNKRGLLAQLYSHAQKLLSGQSLEVLSQGGTLLKVLQVGRLGRVGPSPNMPYHLVAGVRDCAQLSCLHPAEVQRPACHSFHTASWPAGSLPPCPAALGAYMAWRQPWHSLQLCNKIASSGQFSLARKPPVTKVGGWGKPGETGPSVTTSYGLVFSKAHLLPEPGDPQEMALLICCSSFPRPSLFMDPCI